MFLECEKVAAGLRVLTNAFLTRITLLGTISRRNGGSARRFPDPLMGVRILSARKAARSLGRGISLNDST